MWPLLVSQPLSNRLLEAKLALFIYSLLYLKYCPRLNIFLSKLFFSPFFSFSPLVSFCFYLALLKPEQIFEVVHEERQVME